MKFEYKLEKSRQFETILYPQEDVNHKHMLEFIHNNFEYIACTHDRDFIIDEETGERIDKKPHTHVIVVFANPRHYKAVSDIFGGHYFLPVASYRVRVRYLVHADDPDKAQYLPTEVFGNRSEDIFTHMKGDNTPVFKRILAYINESKRTFMELVQWCVDEGYLDVLQKNAYIFSRLVRESPCSSDSSNGRRSE